MIPASFEESNDYLNPPPGMDLENCSVLSVHRGNTLDGTTVVISCWKLTKEELEEVNRTGRVWLGVMGVTMPPVWIVAEKPFE